MMMMETMSHKPMLLMDYFLTWKMLTPGCWPEILTTCPAVTVTMQQCVLSQISVSPMSTPMLPALTLSRRPSPGVLSSQTSSSCTTSPCCSCCALPPQSWSLPLSMCTSPQQWEPRPMTTSPTTSGWHWPRVWPCGVHVSLSECCPNGVSSMIDCPCQCFYFFLVIHTIYWGKGCANIDNNWKLIGLKILIDDNIVIELRW